MTPPPGLPDKLEHFIGGKHAASADGATFDVADPVTNLPYASVAAGGPEDIDRAVTAASAAFTGDPWPGLPARQRAGILNRIADGIEARADRIAELETFDTGLPVTQARGQAARAAENFRFFADLTVTLHEDAFRTNNQFGYVIRKPAGVAGLITPWNTPFMLETWKLAPALASGCTVVLKPAEWTPLSASLLPEIMTEAGLPAGVFNLVHGIGEVAGAALVAHPRVPRISFTGETTTGQTIMAAAAPHLKGLSMELGGKSPCVVFADADLDHAVDSALFGVFSLNGGSGARPAPGFWPNGPSTTPWSPGSPPGPNASGWATPPTRGPSSARWCTPSTTPACSATCRPGGTKARGWWRAEPPGSPERGNYLAATVFADVEPSMRIFREEIFGPVVCVSSLGGRGRGGRPGQRDRLRARRYIWTRDLARAHRVAHAVESGMTWINSHNVRDLRTPFGGVKASGLGREGGPHSLDFYTESRIVHVPLGDTRVPRFGA